MDKYYPLEPYIFQESEEEILSGIIICPKCLRWYPISEGVPEMLPDELRKEDDDKAFLRTWKSLLPFSLKPWLKQITNKTYTRETLDFYEKCALEFTLKALKDIKNQVFEPLPQDHFLRILYITELMKKVDWNNFLEIGSGLSPILEMYKGRFPESNTAETYGIDVTRSFCWVAQKLQKIQSIRADWVFIPFKDKSFDLVVWSEGPEHAIDPDYVFQNIKNITKKFFITSVPAWQYLIPGHLHIFSRESFEQRLSPFFEITSLKVIDYPKEHPCWIVALCQPKT